MIPFRLESDFLEHNASSLPLSSYLETAVPRWGRDLEAKRPKETKTCLLLVISSSARRAVDVNRDANAFKGKQCVSAKLFSKHMKVTKIMALLTVSTESALKEAGNSVLTASVFYM